MLSYSFYESDTRILQYTRALVERGDHVDVLALRAEGTPAQESLDGVDVYRILKRKINEQSQITYLVRILRFLLVSAAVLARRHASRKYDVIHVHNVPDFLVFAGLLPKLLGARVVLDIHDILPEFYASKFHCRTDSLLFRLAVFVERVSIACADHVIIANELWMQRLIARSVAAEKCLTVINYPDPRLFYRRDRARSSSQFRIIYPGTLNHHQGVDIALRAFAVVAAQMPNAEFHIYGEGSEKLSLQNLARDLGLDERITFHGFLRTTEIAEIMAASDLAVVPKRASSLFGNEAASTKIMEFMSVGVPVIVSRTRIDAFYHNDTRVRFFESENVDELAAAMIELFENRERRESLVANASEYVQRNNWVEKRREYLDVVDWLVRSKNEKAADVAHV